MGDGRWHTWGELRRRPHITFTFDAIADRTGGGFYGRYGNLAVIAVSHDLHPRDRRAIVTHELGHDDRLVLAPDASPATMQTEERIVRRLTARRLVPLDELEDLVVALVEVNGSVEAYVVAEEFEVPLEVAEEAGRQLQAKLLERELLRSRPLPER